MSKEEAKQFEERYRYYQKHIQVPEITKQILDHCKENYRIGILTNGTTKNQGKKLETLGSDHWFNPKTMFISDSIGAAKPDVKAFHTVQKEMKLDPEETWFIGDTFEIDVVGAKNSGWHVIWFNHRNRPMPEGDIVPDVEVTSGQELFEYIKKMEL